MNKKNLINYVLICIIFLLFSVFFGKDYFEFQKNSSENTKTIEFAQKSAKNFKISDIKNIENTEVYYTPYPKLIQKIVSKIQKAEQKVYLEVYMFTEKRIKTALIKAKKRGIEVKVLLEKNPYRTANINNKVFNELQKFGVDVTWSNTKNYSLNHSKFFIMDDEIIISTGNMTYSTFKFNRDFFVFSKDKEIVKKVEQIFLNDFAGKKAEIYDTSLVVSPNYARKKIETLLDGAKKEIKIYMQYLKDDGVNSILQKKQKEGIDIQILINTNNQEDEEIMDLRERGISIQTLKTIKMHSKVIIVDKKYMFIGSENFSSYSLDKNREMGILMKNSDLIEKVLGVFEKDWIRE